MPDVFPFKAALFSEGRGDVSTSIAPPYDVLDAQSKAALLKRDDRNVVWIDLPHTPAKELGPPEAYKLAGHDYRNWLCDGTLTRRKVPAMFAYRQSFRDANGKEVGRAGMACAVEAIPFGPRPGGGVLPHEETFSGPKEDRLALMKATRAQLSPIFGLFADDAGRATSLLQKVMGARGPDMTARSDWGGTEVLHEVWTIEDGSTITSYQDALAGEDVFIADGHHRYTTQLNYLKALEAERGAVEADHPARRCMIVLVGMSDPGLVIWPTHRVLGGMSAYSYESFLLASKGLLRIEPIGSPGDLPGLERALNDHASRDQLRLGLYDFATRRCLLAFPTSADPLAARFPGKPGAWRTLDVAIVQHLVVEQVCQPKLNGGQPVQWAFPHTIAEVEQIGHGAETGAGGGKGFKPQLAVIVRPTPLSAVRAVSKAGELMPQKSTFFYPKLATGLWINPLE